MGWFKSEEREKAEKYQAVAEYLEEKIPQIENNITTATNDMDVVYASLNSQEDSAEGHFMAMLDTKLQIWRWNYKFILNALMAAKQGLEEQKAMATTMAAMWSRLADEKEAQDD